MKEKTAKKLLTLRMFKRLLEGLEQRLDAKIEGVKKILELKMTDVDSKVHNVALLSLKTAERVTHIHETMATKQDINKIMNILDSLSGQLKAIDQEQKVQALRIRELQSSR